MKSVYLKHHGNLGFNLIELMITLIIMAILAGVAIPAYSNHVIRGKLSDGQSALSDLRLRMAQNYQDNRTYDDGNAGTVNICTAAVTLANTDYFSFTCSASTATTYTWTAASLANAGLGAAGDYTYTIDQNGAKVTTRFAGTAGVSACWKSKSDDC